MAPQPVVFSKLVVSLAGNAMGHEDGLAVRGEDVSQGSQDGAVVLGHGGKGEKEKAKKRREEAKREQQEETV